MRNIAKLLSIGLLTLCLVACDNQSDRESISNPNQPVVTQHGDKVTLLNGKFNFTLPAGMADQSSKLEPPYNSKFIYTNSTGTISVIALIDSVSETPLAENAQQIIEQRKSRDAKLEILDNKAIEVDGHTFQQLDTVALESKSRVLSTIILGYIADKKLTVQISAPADDLPAAQKVTNDIIASFEIE